MVFQPIKPENQQRILYHRIDIINDIWSLFGKISTYGKLSIVVLIGRWMSNSDWLSNENQEKDEIKNPTTEILYQEMENFLYDTNAATDIIKKPGLQGYTKLTDVEVERIAEPWKDWSEWYSSYMDI